VYAEKNSKDPRVSPDPRHDWFLVSAEDEVQNLTANIEGVPDTLWSDPSGRVFVGLAKGDLWRIHLDSGKWTNIAAAFDPHIGAVSWPNERSYGNPGLMYSVPDSAGFARILVSVRREDTLTDYYRVDVAKGELRPVARPSRYAQPINFRPESDVIVFVAEERNGTFLTVDVTGRHRTLFRANEFLSEIAESERRTIDYRTLEGEAAKALLLLPPDYRPGRTYPTVVHVCGCGYTGVWPHSRLNDPHPLNLQLLAAPGYVVLIPSEPVPDTRADSGKYADPYGRVLNGVAPAVDKAIQLGYSDPRRIAVLGQSAGGYATFSLITLTNRFRAAIALAGYGTLSAYGIFDARDRYGSYPHENTFWQSLFETTRELGLGTQPWAGVGRYIRNMPFFHVDRIDTPLLIIHGDMDMVPIQGVEELFTAVYRQGRRARFVRYWGEGHVFQSPANIRDSWMQIYRWLAEYLN
jgi:dipeptidyl aminopeptidase/acylaminoacyl peptidase